VLSLAPNHNCDIQKMNFELARFNMVEQQIRTWEVLDQKVLDLVGSTARENFVPEKFQRLAYADTEVPLPDGQVMLAPKLGARILQALQVTRDEMVLEIGTGSGYLTRMLAEFSRHVVSVELSRTLHEEASRRLSAAGAENVSLHCGDGASGWAADGPYDVIVLTGSIGNIDKAPLDQVRIGGRLFAIVGTAPAMQAVLVTRKTESSFVQDSLFETVVPPLKGAEARESFVL